ncbi:hypothetical protein GCM10027591_01920 [Zhihengliuella somnathii]
MTVNGASGRESGTAAVNVSEGAQNVFWPIPTTSAAAPKTMATMADKIRTCLLTYRRGSGSGSGAGQSPPNDTINDNELITLFGSRHPGTRPCDVHPTPLRAGQPLS